MFVQVIKTTYVCLTSWIIEMVVSYWWKKHVVTLLEKVLMHSDKM